MIAWQADRPPTAALRLDPQDGRRLVCGFSSAAHLKSPPGPASTGSGHAQCLTTASALLDKCLLDACTSRGCLAQVTKVALGGARRVLPHAIMILKLSLVHDVRLVRPDGAFVRVECGDRCGELRRCHPDLPMPRSICGRLRCADRGWPRYAHGAGRAWLGVASRRACKVISPTIIACPSCGARSRVGSCARHTALSSMQVAASVNGRRGRGDICR
jgi:hypothetical protein